MNTFKNLQMIIPLKRKTKESILEMMDVFLMNDRITIEQYEELIGMLTTHYPAE